MAVDSIYDALERAKGLYRQERFSHALACYRELAARALPAAPDVWIEATFGVAECHRIASDLAAAMASYQDLITRGRHLPPTRGRLEESNKMALIHSLLHAVDIGRASLRLPDQALYQMLRFGHCWGRALLHPEAARCAFTYGELLLERQREELPAVAERLQQLCAEAARLEPRCRPVEQLVIAYTRAETQLDAGLYHEALPAPPPRDHFAYQWARCARPLLYARAAMEQGHLRDAASRLAELAEQQQALATYPDLELCYLTMSAATGKGARGARARRDVVQRLRDAIAEGCAQIADLATPLWNLVWLVVFTLDTKGRAWAEEADLLGGTLRSTPWLQGTIRSRGVGAEELKRILAWCERSEEPAPPEVEKLLRRLRQAVRP